MLSAHVPRNLRVRSSIQISSTRVPARAFLIVAGLIFCGGLLIVGGADLMRTLRLTGALILIALAVFELRCWGRSMREVVQILIRHVLRPDGVAVGIVSGGAPAWDLLSLAARAQIGSAYHRLLLSLDTPIDVYVVDQPPDLADEIATLLDRQDDAD